MFGSLLTMSLALPPLYMMFKDTGQRGWGFSTVVEHLPSMCKVLGLITSTQRDTEGVCLYYNTGKLQKHYVV